MTRIFTLALAVLVSLPMLSPQANAGDDDRVRLISRMANVGANANAQGKARWEMRDGGRMKLDVEGRFLSADFTSVDVFLNGKFIGSAPVAFGSFDIDIDTNKGDIVPVVAAGDLVEAYDSTTSELLFTGTFSSNRGGGGDGGGGGKEIELSVDLANVGANTLASAHARHRTRGSRLRFDVEGEDLSADFSSVEIYAAGNYIANADINELGRFEIDLDTLKGSKNVPALVEGDVVEVFDATSGNILFTGALQVEK